MVYLVLRVRTDEVSLELGEWDIDERVQDVWAAVQRGQQDNLPGLRYYGRESVLAWLMRLMVFIVDSHLHYRWL